MSIDIRIPTILRPYTKDQKSVQAEGANLGSLIADLDANYPGIGERLLENGALRRFINIYINDEDAADILIEHKDTAGVYDLFLYSATGEAVLKQYGKATLLAAVTRT
jgi:molybdopterin converting factor small subunit